MRFYACDAQLNLCNFAHLMIRKNIPNAITCGNLLCGCLAIMAAFNGKLIVAAYLVGIAAVLDFLDGFVARLLKVHSEIGKQLDSLADMVTFGVVPGFIAYKLLWFSSLLYHLSSYITLFAFVIPVFSAIRLAKFNIDTRQTDSFIGVPTPANTILWASFPLILGASLNGYVVAVYRSYPASPPQLAGILLNPYFLIGLTLLMSFLLIAELPLFALKFKHFKWKGNEIRFVFLILSVVLLILFKFVAIPFIIFLYVILSVINNIGKKKKEQDYDLIAKQ